MKRLLLTLFAPFLFVQALSAGNCSWITPPPSVIITSSYSDFSTSNYSVSNPFSFQCTPNTTATVTLTRGLNSSTYVPRTMLITNPPPGYPLADRQLQYNLFTTTGQVWGDGTSGTFQVNFTPSPQNKIYDQTDGAIITATAFSGQDIVTGDAGAGGVYTDTITVTLCWGANCASQAPNQTFTVQTTVIPECRVDTFSIPFGTYDPVAANLTTPKDANATVNVYCTKSTAATVSLDAGLNSSGGSRRMKNTTIAGAFLNYDIYKTPYTTIWNTANTNGATSSSKLAKLGPPGGFIGFGRIPAGQNPSVGSHTDTVQAVVNY